MYLKTNKSSFATFRLWTVSLCVVLLTVIHHGFVPSPPIRSRLGTNNQSSQTN